MHDRMLMPTSETTDTKPRIVALDDDAGMLALLRHTLEPEHFSVTSYNDPRAGIEAVFNDPPDLIITDLTMPGMSGIQIIEQIRKHHPNDSLPIIVLSGTGDEEVILRCFNAGATDYLVKPFGEGEIRAKVKILLRRAQEEKARPTSQIGDLVFDEDGTWNSDDLVGKIFAGYEILGKLGEGGMGVVYRARCTATQRIVALKVLAPEYARDKGFLKRFFREANHLKEVEHKNIAKFFELGHDRHTYYIAMEFVDGPSLEDYLHERDLLSEFEVVEIVMQVAQALNALHKRGIVHRDVKPGNILIGNDGTCKLVDFGLTKRPTDERLTESNIFFGTATYMSPEQARGSAAVDIRSDIYALGILFFFLATGEVPFDSADTYGILFKQVHEAPPEPQQKNPLLTDTANFLILKMLNKEPEKRYQTPAELLRALKKHRDLLRARSGRFRRADTSAHDVSSMPDS